MDSELAVEVEGKTKATKARRITELKNNTSEVIVDHVAVMLIPNLESLFRFFPHRVGISNFQENSQKFHGEWN